MSKLAGFLNGKKIYHDDPKINDIVCKADFVVVWDGDIAAETRCDYCGRANHGREDCQSCGAVLP